MGSGSFFRSNQNTYLLEAVGPSYPSLRSDWLLGTSDSFPVFTRLARVAFVVGGQRGLAVLMVMASFVAFAAIGVVAVTAARQSGTAHRRLSVAIAVVVALAAWQRIPDSAFGWMPGRVKLDVFRGFGGQYLLSYPGMLQPSDAGVLLLAAAALCLVARTLVDRRRPLLVVAALLSAGACSLHASYLAPLMLALISIALADVLTGERLSSPWALLATGVGAGLAVLVSNPVARAAGGRGTDAQEFVAFERIPHHSLISHWSPEQTVIASLVIVAGALLSVRLLRSWWAAFVMFATLAGSLLAAVMVEVTRSTTLASVFPWRITVVIVPLAFVFIAVSLVQWVVRPIDPRAVLAIAGVAALGIAVTGVQDTRHALDAPPSSLVATLRAADLPGVGLVPIAAEDVRLNARVPVFVDWKSHPYAPDELTEWVRRVTATSAAYADDVLLCDLVDAESLDWAVLVSGTVPTCFDGWPTIAGDGFLIVRRP